MASATQRRPRSASTRSFPSSPRLQPIAAEDGRTPGGRRVEASGEAAPAVDNRAGPSRRAARRPVRCVGSDGIPAPAAPGRSERQRAPGRPERGGSDDAPTPEPPAPDAEGRRPLAPRVGPPVGDPRPRHGPHAHAGLRDAVPVAPGRRPAEAAPLLRAPPAGEPTPSSSRRRCGPARSSPTARPARPPPSRRRSRRVRDVATRAEVRAPRGARRVPAQGARPEPRDDADAAVLRRGDGEPGPAPRDGTVPRPGAARRRRPDPGGEALPEAQPARGEGARPSAASSSRSTPTRTPSSRPSTRARCT